MADAGGVQLEGFTPPATMSSSSAAVDVDVDIGEDLTPIVDET